MHESGSALLTMVETVRLVLEQAYIDKYDDDYILRMMIYPAYARAMTGMAFEQDDQVYCTAAIAMTEGLAEYELPPCMQEVIDLRQTDEGTGLLISSFRPENIMHPLGEGWRIEGNMLVLDPPLGEDATWTLLYTPSGDCCPHYGTGVVRDTQTTIALPVTPTIGIRDKRANAYVGQVLRIFGTNVWQERVISAYDVVSRKVTPRIPFDTDNLPADGESVTYEIAPLGNRSVWDYVAAEAAMVLAESRDVPEKKLIAVDKMLQRARKAMYDRVSTIRARTGKRFARLTVDNVEVAADPWRFGHPAS